MDTIQLLIQPTQVFIMSCAIEGLQIVAVILHLLEM
jgi:hypothetical protein